MRRALDLALEGWGQTAPNPMVGAVVVAGDEIVGEGFHARFGAAHAETVALENAGKAAAGSTLYVTLEPCTHFGKTPPCVTAIIEAGISRVVIAASDPSPDASGGAHILESNGVDVSTGVLESAARELNAPFFHRFASDRPWVTLKLAVTMDGAVADSAGSSKWITGVASREEVHRLRAGSDAIAVGQGTLLADDPALTVRGAVTPRVPPARVIFASANDVPLSAAVFSSAGDAPTFVVTRAISAARRSDLSSRGVRVITAGSIAEALRELRETGIHSLLVEGGAGLAAELIEGGLVDRLVTFQAPVILGEGARGAFARVGSRAIGDPLRFRVVSRAFHGDDVMTVYAPVTP